MHRVPDLRAHAIALPAVILVAACFARSENESGSRAAPVAAESQLDPAQLRWEAEQRREPLDGLTEDELFKQLDRPSLSTDAPDAIPKEQRDRILAKILREGSPSAADRLDELAAQNRLGETRKGVPRSAGVLEYVAEEIRFRHTGDRKHLVRAALIITNPEDETLASKPSSSHATEIVRQGIVEARGNLVLLAERARKNRVEDTGYWSDSDIEMTRRAIMFLDLWRDGKTAEETFVRAVEQEQYPPLRPCGVDHLLELDQVSGSTRRRVREALMPSVEAAQLRMRTPKGSLTPSMPSAGGTSTTPEDFTNTCALYGFWLKFSKEELRAAEGKRFFVGPAPCGLHYQVGERVGDDRCP